MMSIDYIREEDADRCSHPTRPRTEKNGEGSWNEDLWPESNSENRYGKNCPKRTDRCIERCVDRCRCQHERGGIFLPEIDILRTSFFAPEFNCD